MLEKTIGKLELLAIHAYRTISHPLYATLDKAHLHVFKCRYEPSCSQYAEDAIKEWGAYKGTVLGFKRILRCSPSGGHGYDPVPKKN
ncbi:MAG: membrane protein insertion efficiency factor YidD [archaeon]